MKQHPELPDTVHGRLMEAVHISGYSFERACSELEWLLDEDRWKSIGKGFTNISDFVATIDFSGFRLAIEQRKKLAKRLNDLEASGRATAKMLGVSHQTINDDLAGKKLPHPETETPETKEETDANGKKLPAAWFHDRELDPAHLAKKEAKKATYAVNREQKHRDIAAKAAGVTTDHLGPFPLLYADPPWKFEVYSEKGLDRAPDQHYPTLTDEEIADFRISGKRVDDIAHRDAALLLWCTSSNIARALEIMKAWDFTYKSQAVWVKDKTGMGLVFRNMHEVLLYGTRGQMPGPQYQPPSVFHYPRGRHSAKPPEIRNEIEKMYPDFNRETRLELFARDQIEGWTCHGFEALHQAAE